ncbi:hypothetical protein EDE15_4080 [Edaphobacter aggregans]|uniref:Uncharacterized protein n=1 Tax=Edaphobacter aggregans TaxID=570835 RepID=A0A428MNQ4_9BACT|nr:hypothetical protein EDE15_4080 [Edaphobacter aggregans]
MILRRLSVALRTAHETLRLSRWTSGALNPIHSLRWTTIGSLILMTCICAFAPMTVLAWLYPEHRSITFLAIKMLEPEQRSQLDALWSEARHGHEGRLCAQMGDSSNGPIPGCIDYAAWPAIAGDHSCSAQEMLRDVLVAPWVPKVAAIGGTLEVKLAAARRRDQRVNAVRHSNIDLLRADPAYVARAMSNNAHFLLARPNTAIDPEAYLSLVLGPGAELNAAGTYTFYHERALGAAARIAEGHLSPEARTEVALAAFADEAYALHFLQDGFAAGHVVGNWGTTAVRKGTHDYYNEHGVEVTTWNGARFVTLGDAFLDPESKKRVATAVRDSLAQLANALDGKLKIQPNNSETIQPDTFNTCQETHFPSAVIDKEAVEALVPVVAETPIPALGDVPGQLPRFRSEFGPFVGISAAAFSQGMNGGFGASQSGASGTAGLEASGRVGVGLEGVLDESGDGLIFAGVGYRQDGPAQGETTVPGRGALTLRVRAPFWLIPGDMVIATPLLALTSPKKLKTMAVQAANGGLIPWQTGIATPIGRFQFVLGREAGISWYKLDTHNPMQLPTPGVAPLDSTLVSVRSIQVDFPILEYRPFRSFYRSQTSSALIQFYAGFDRPTETSVVSPVNAPTPNLRTIGLAGIRVAFDWRYYLK